MSTITLRATKGSPLTNTEVDTNFSNLNTDKLESTYAGAMNSLTGGSSIVTLSSTTGVTTGVWKATTISPLYGGTGVAQASASSTLTISGAYGTTFTVSGTTALTLPTSGTVATTSNKLSAFAATTSSELLGVISDETGSGLLVFATSPTLTTPVLGVASATSINKVAFTAPATSATLTIADGTTISTAGNFTTSGAYAMTLTATGATSVTLPTSGTLVNSAVTTLSSLASIGTITSGVWNGTAIGLAYGGTNANITATAGAVVYSTSSALGVTAAGTSGQLLQSNGTSAPSWTTPSYASTGKAIAMAIVFGF